MVRLRLGAGLALLLVWVATMGARCTDPSSSPIGAGGTLVLPITGPAVALPAKATVRVSPNPWVKVLYSGRTALTILVTTPALPTNAPVANVPIEVSITPGQDKGVTSLFDLGINPVTGGRVVGTQVVGATDARGVFPLGVKATADGDEDVITIVVDPKGAASQTITLKYSTRIP